MAIGNALVAAKLQYLEQTPPLGDLHVKALLEATLYGLPMLGVNMPAGRGWLEPRRDEHDAGAGRRRARHHDRAQVLRPHPDTPNVAQPKVLNVQGGGTITATYLKGADGKVFTLPGAPLLPLYSADVTAPAATSSAASSSRAARTRTPRSLR